MILREVLLDRCFLRLRKTEVDSFDVVETTVDAVIEKDEYHSEEMQRLAGYRLYGQADHNFALGRLQVAYSLPESIRGPSGSFLFRKSTIDARRHVFVPVCAPHGSIMIAK